MNKEENLLQDYTHEELEIALRALMDQKFAEEAIQEGIPIAQFLMDSELQKALLNFFDKETQTMRKDCLDQVEVIAWIPITIIKEYCKNEFFAFDIESKRICYDYPTRNSLIYLLHQFNIKNDNVSQNEQLWVEAFIRLAQIFEEKTGIKIELMSSIPSEFEILDNQEEIPRAIYNEEIAFCTRDIDLFKLENTNARIIKFIKDIE